MSNDDYEIVINLYYYHKDHLWSIVGITDTDWTVVVTYEYDSFWNFEITSWTDIWNTRLFTWREYEKEIDLYYYRARYYSSELWRFISRDPIDIADDIILYAYVGNNPVMFVNPLGNKAKKMTGGEVIDTAASFSPHYDAWWIIWWLALYWFWLIEWDDNIKSAWLEWVSQSWKNLINPFSKIKKWQKTAKLFGWGKKNWKPNINKIENPKLKSIINRNYRDNAVIWNWSTADAIRYEKSTWKKVWWRSHLQKWKDTIKWLEKLLKWWNLNNFEKETAKNIINDLKNAIK